MHLDWLQIFLLFGIIQGFLLSVIILTGHFFRSTANRWLGCALLMVSLLALNDWIKGLVLDNPWLDTFNHFMWEFIFPVAILFYFAHLLKHPLAKHPRRYLLLLPYAITFAINMFINFDQELGFYRFSIMHDGVSTDIYYFWESLFALLFNAACLWKAYQMQARQPRTIITRWLQQVWTLIIIVFSSWFLVWVLRHFYTIEAYELLWIGTIVLFYWISYWGVLRFRLALDRFEIKTHLASQSPSVEQVVTLQKAYDNNLYFTRLEQWMKTEKYYRESGLNRQLIAERLGISPGYLSQIISKTTDASVTDYINHYRVEELKRLLIEPSFANYSLLALAYEVGFNSKSTFYAVFKKSTGLTPSAFQKAHKKGPDQQEMRLSDY